ncbi:hypothetical protein JTE90_019803 [Oedothorax gibbosus]|uniref:Uncharacterized protein n=1 Tax=Oedothorax gibbosus TaxID=931172 RepID=A0AAV6V821_9ARAC|nr:hypothetical protein JTE90_019803 [Oedothorax gibbosus]
MLTRLNTGGEISILPTGLGNHYTSNNKHLIPPGRKRLPYNHSVSSTSDCFMGDSNAPEANMSFREQQEYFGPDVLVIIGLVLASLGAILTLVSFYCQFRHPAIQATMAGIGPSLVGIGMLFCVLRLFFCTFCISRTCCECIADGFRALAGRCPGQQTKKKVHPLQIKDVAVAKLVANGHLGGQSFNRETTRKQGNGVVSKTVNNNNIVRLLPLEGAVAAPDLNSLPMRMEPIHEEHQRTETSPSGKTDSNSDDFLNDEIDLLDEMKSSDASPRSLHKDINELVMKNQKQRY